MILDDAGQLVWFHPLDTEGVTDFRAQRYDGRPVLTWWRGKSELGVGDGHYVIVDDAYREIATVSAGNGLTGDIHEFLITDRDTALITIYHELPADLSSIGGPKDGAILEGVVQELDIGTGRVLFEWHSAPEVELEESYAEVPKAEKGEEADAYDYFHINSVAEDEDGNFLVSARNTHAVYKISRARRKVMWRLGGKRSDYSARQRRALRLAARRAAPAGRDAHALRQRFGRRRREGTLVACRRAAARRRGEAGDPREVIRAPDQAPGDDAGQRAVPGRWPRLRRLGIAALLHRVRP